MSQPLGQSALLLFDPPPVGDVLDQREQVARRTRLVAHEAEAEPRPDVRAVLAQVALLELVLLPLSLQQRRQERALDEMVVRVSKGLAGLAEDLVAAAPEELLGRRVDLDHKAFEVEQRDRGRGFLNDQPIRVRVGMRSHETATVTRRTGARAERGGAA